MIRFISIPYAVIRRRRKTYAAAAAFATLLAAGTFGLGQRSEPVRPAIEPSGTAGVPTAAFVPRQRIARRGALRATRAARFAPPAPAWWQGEPDDPGQPGAFAVLAPEPEPGTAEQPAIIAAYSFSPGAVTGSGGPDIFTTSKDPPPPSQPGVPGPPTSNPPPTSEPIGDSGDTPSGISAVPEPESWALLILGLGFVGAMMRRRKLARAAHPA